jgi:hypothetical protein
VASTSMGEDCGEGFAPPSKWATLFAMNQASPDPWIATRAGSASR